MERFSDTPAAIRIALAKDPERYVLLFDETAVDEAMRAIGRWAANPELTFDWGDCVALSREIQRKVRK